METMFRSCCSKIPQETVPEGIAEVTMWVRLSQRLRRGALALVLVLGWCGAPPRTLAAGVVGEGTPGSCTEAALDAALAGGGSVTFNCGASPVTITVTAWKTIATKTSLDGGGLITLSGGGATRVLSIIKKGTVTLARLTISDGVVSGDGGGAILNFGKLTVTNCTFFNNSALWGGAIRNLSGTLNVINSSFSNNGASFSGGAIASSKKLTVTNSTFSNNSAIAGGAIINFKKLTVINSIFSKNTSTGIEGGGAMYNVGGLAVTNSTFSDNVAGGVGGAVVNTRTLTVTNSTFSNNSSAHFGGAINNEVSGKLTVTNCTFANNSTADGIGATIRNDGKLTFTNTIVANGVLGEDCAGPGITDKGHNLDSGMSCGFSSAKGSLSNTDPQLDPAGLADNGGPTQTIAVEADSPAISAGDQRVCKKAPVKNLDQRGFVRPGTGNTNCTIGAYEFNSPGPAVSREAE